MSLYVYLGEAGRGSDERHGVLPRTSHCGRLDSFRLPRNERLGGCAGLAAGALIQMYVRIYILGVQSPYACGGQRPH